MTRYIAMVGRRRAATNRGSVGAQPSMEARMNRRCFALALCALAMLAMVPTVGGQNGGQAGSTPIGGTLTPAKADERGWGWQVKALMAPATTRPLYNRAKERLLHDKQITSY